MHRSCFARPSLFKPALLALGLAFFAGVAPPLLAQAPLEQPPVAAQTETKRLGDVLLIDDLMQVVQAEGLEYGDGLRDEMFPGKGAGWPVIVTAIYDPQRARAEFDVALAQALGEDAATTAAGIAFFESATGQKILNLELEARRALLDPQAEAAAAEVARRMRDENAPRMEALEDFARINDLVELNVMGALNANLAFYRGLSDGGAFGDGMTESDMLADVWAQEDDIRAETEKWLWPYLALAYGPLSDEELQGYADFSASDAGQRLNAAIFAAFDAVFLRISEDLGRAAAGQMQGEDI